MGLLCGVDSINELRIESVVIHKPKSFDHHISLELQLNKTNSSNDQTQKKTSRTQFSSVHSDNMINSAEWLC